MRDRLKQILVDHQFDPVFGCSCPPTNEDGSTTPIGKSYEDHVVDLILEEVEG